MKTAEKACLDSGYKTASVINLMINKIMKPLTEKSTIKINISFLRISSINYLSICKIEQWGRVK
jgi:hypothetical protein